MAALDFPNAPAIGDKYPTTVTGGLAQYTWDGEKWTTIGGTTIASAPATAIPLPNFGTGAVGTSIKYAREDHVHPADAAKVALAGDTMTGNLGVPNINMLATGPSSQSWITFRRDNLSRWGVLLNTGPDSGGNAGSDFVIGRFTDAGSYIDAPISITRNDGRVSVVGDPTSALHVAPKQYVDSTVNTAAGARVAKSGDTMTGALTLNAGQTVNVTGSIGTGGPNGFLVQGGQPSISFLIPGVFGANLGMDAGGNFYTGGWSLGGPFRIWTTRDFGQTPWTPASLANPGYPVQYCRWVFAGDRDEDYTSVGSPEISGAAVTKITAHVTAPTGGGSEYGGPWVQYVAVTLSARLRYFQIWTANYGDYITVGWSS
jgi:hypothetical protein